MTGLRTDWDLLGLEPHDAGTIGAIPSDLSRRGFFRVSAGVGAGLLLGIGLDQPAQAQQAAATPPFAPAAYVRIAPNGRITLLSKNPEIGQGIKTAFALILAEELDANWDNVSVIQAPIDSALYGQQSAGGSRSIPANWMTLRQAGAGARAMLIAAAARRWSVPERELTTSASTVIHQPTGRSASYGSLADAAAQVPLPDPRSLQLKGKQAFQLLGKRHGGVDNRQIVTGQPLFGLDVDVPGMKIAVFQKCPRPYGRVRQANLADIRKLPGVLDAFVVEGTGKPAEVLNGVAIIAQDTWSALSAKRQLAIEWDETPASQDSWTAIVEQAKKSPLSPLANKPFAPTAI